MRRMLHVLLVFALAGLLALLAFILTRSTIGDDAFSAPGDSATPAPAASVPAAAGDRGALAVPIDRLEHAPGGRSDVAWVDAVIDALVTGAPDALAILATVPWEGIFDCATTQPRALDARATTDAFVSSRAPLHSVFTPEPTGDEAASERFAVVFGYGRRGGAPEATLRAWRVDVTDGRISGASTHCGFTDVLFEPPLSAIERYLLLPPEADLPPPVALYTTPPVTSSAALDEIVRGAVAGDGAALATRLRATEAGCVTTPGGPFAAPLCPASALAGDRVSVVPVIECGRVHFVARSDAQAELAALFDAPPRALHAIALTPPGYVAPGDSLVLLARATRRYNWTSFGLVVADDVITGLVKPCADGRPEWLYPPTVLRGPYAEAVTGDGPTWSGIPAVDRAIVALSSGDPARLSDAFDPVLIGCDPAAMGIGAPPRCLDGEAPGTLVPVLPIVGCEIEYVRDREFGRLADTLAEIAPRLYAVTAPSRGFADFWRVAEYMLLLYNAAPTGANPYPTIAISAAGIAGFASGCDDSLTTNLLRPSIAPSFLVPPPR